jgi:hypothetical protein
MGDYAKVDYNLTLCPLQSLLQHIYHRQPYKPESTLSPERDFGFGLRVQKYKAPALLSRGSDFVAKFAAVTP